MKIDTKKHNFEEMYQVGNVIQWINGNIYLIVDHGEFDYSLVDLTNNKVYATYDTLENLISELASESDVLLNAEINVFWGEINMDYQKKVDMKEVKEIQKQATEIAKILKKEGYEAGVIALGKGTGVATNVFGNRKDVLFTVYTILENLKEEDKLMLLSMILGINLGDE